MAYNETFASSIQNAGGVLDFDLLPDPTEVYEAVIGFYDWFTGLDEVDQGAYEIAWSAGLTADVFEQAGVPVPRWLLDAVDPITELGDAVGVASTATTEASDAIA